MSSGQNVLAQKEFQTEKEQDTAVVCVDIKYHPHWVAIEKDLHLSLSSIPVSSSLLGSTKQAQLSEYIVSKLTLEDTVYVAYMSAFDSKIYKTNVYLKYPTTPNLHDIFLSHPQRVCAPDFGNPCSDVRHVPWLQKGREAPV